MASPSQDLRTIVADDVMALMRAGYVDRRAQAIFRPYFQEGYPPHWPLHREYQDMAYPGPLPVSLREATILAILTGVGADPADYQVHIYCALAGGLSVDQVMGHLLYASEYAGIARYVDATNALRAVLDLIAARAEAGQSLEDLAILGVLLSGGLIPGA